MPLQAHRGVPGYALVMIHHVPRTGALAVRISWPPWCSGSFATGSTFPQR